MVERAADLDCLVFLAYIALALIVQLHLSKTNREDWYEYRNKVGILLPLARSRNRVVEIFLSLVLLALMMYGLALHSIFWPSIRKRHPHYELHKAKNP